MKVKLCDLKEFSTKIIFNRNYISISCLLFPGHLLFPHLIYTSPAMGPVLNSL